MEYNYIDLCWDCDGVIFDDFPLFAKYARKEGIRYGDPTESVEKIINFFRTLDWYSVLRESPIINDAINAINQTHASGKFRLTPILSSCFTDYEGEAKITVLRERGLNPNIPIITVQKPYTKAEALIAYYKELGHSISENEPIRAVLTDDHKPNAPDWIKHGGIFIKFNDVPKTDESFHVVTNLLEVPALFRDIDIRNIPFEDVKEHIKSKIK